ncbi:MAG TPA: VOC family protein [Candidatus Didemnitutus sp.]
MNCEKQNLPRLNLLVLRARDADALATFYSALGLRFVRHRHGTGPEHHAAEGPGSVFEIYPANADGATQAVRIGFAVEDVRVAVERAQAAGGTIVSPPVDSPWVLRAVVSDLEGHRMELTQVHGPTP